MYWFPDFLLEFAYRTHHVILEQLKKEEFIEGGEQTGPEKPA
jgi:hypothetical protein